ncbi:hypothetical protein I3843_08G102700 [Carya illinoinensis]|uniref:Uncharacterized protein n=1 Tax=Carya illinoinensis TaxID=32201 RepID=A0A922EE11_CARIL|nr:hypothetical protein I3842_08G106800 [Carya illinoinensis]KAG7967511.1 hypothetical protein I3843_08G102700 [Carya illinoinensis]
MPRVFGLLTKPLTRFLLPQSKHTVSKVQSNPSTPKSVTVPFLGEGQDSEFDLPEITWPSSIRALLDTPTHTVHRYLRKFDDAFMHPVFGGRGFVPFVPGSPTEQGSLFSGLAYFQGN